MAEVQVPTIDVVEPDATSTVLGVVAGGEVKRLEAGPSFGQLAAVDGADKIGTPAGTVQAAIDARPTTAELAESDAATRIGSQADAAAAVAQSLADKIFIRKDVFDVIPVSERSAITAGASTYDATAKVVAAFTWANGFLRNGAVASFKLPGACLTIPPGKYQLDTLAAPIPVLCNVICEGAEFVVPAGYAGEVFRVGLDTSGVNLSAAKIELPNVSKVHVDTDPVDGSVGVRLCNINASDITLGRTTHMETAWRCGGIGEGTVYNRIWLGQAIYCKRILDLTPGSGGWCNSNAFYAGNLSQSPGFAGGGVRRTGWRHLVMDGRAPATSVVGNVFFNTAFEGNTSEYLFDIQNAYENTWVNCYHETGAPSEAVTVSGDTLTRVAHGRTAGDAMVFNATVAPTGMQLALPYYVVEVLTADTMKISLNKGGPAVTFSSAGIAVTYKLCMRLLFAQSGSDNNYGNRLVGTFMPPSIALDVIETGVANNNGEARAARDFKSVFDAADMPPWRGQNKSGTALRRPIFAAYPTTAHPILQPEMWTTALSDRGIFFKNSVGAEIGHVSVSGGALSYRANNEGTAYEIATCRRAPSKINIAALSVPADGQATTTVTLTGASTFDYVVINPESLLATGLSIAWARCNGANTVQICFGNSTGSPISMTADFWVMAVRRFF